MSKVNVAGARKRSGKLRQPGRPSNPKKGSMRTLTFQATVVGEADHAAMDKAQRADARSKARVWWAVCKAVALHTVRFSDNADALRTYTSALFNTPVPSKDPERSRVLGSIRAKRSRLARAYEVVSDLVGSTRVPTDERSCRAFAQALNSGTTWILAQFGDGKTPSSKLWKSRSAVDIPLTAPPVRKKAAQKGTKAPEGAKVPEGAEAPSSPPEVGWAQRLQNAIESGKDSGLDRVRNVVFEALRSTFNVDLRAAFLENEKRSAALLKDNARLTSALRSAEARAASAESALAKRKGNKRGAA